MMDFYEHFFFWPALSVVNFACVHSLKIAVLYRLAFPFLLLYASYAIFQSIRMAQKLKTEYEYEISTQAIAKDTIALPGSFIFFSIFTGSLNIGGAILRFQRIYLVGLPSLAWLATLHRKLGSNNMDKLTEADFTAALNDWTSVFLCFALLLAGVFNFATAWELRVRDRWIEGIPLATVTKPDEEAK